MIELREGSSNGTNSYPRDHEVFVLEPGRKFDNTANRNKASFDLFDHLGKQIGKKALGPLGHRGS